MNRRALLAMSTVAVGCGGSSGRYFGRTAPPRRQRLVMAIGAAPGTLDPGQSWDIWEPYAVRALFQGLTDYHPRTLEPIAALATHYEASPDLTQFTFYLRGHRNPRGRPLAGNPGTSKPAIWSDGTTITAHDFVYSWRRAVDPANGFLTAHLFYPIRNAQAVNLGTAKPDALGVRAAGDFALQVDLREPSAHFPRMAASNQFFPVPRQAIESAGSYWTQPANMVCSGAFRLTQWRDGEVVLGSNPSYYDAAGVLLRELRLVAISSPATTMNLYKAGGIDLVTPFLPSFYQSILRRVPDFHEHPAIGNHYLVMNTRNPPLDNVLVRYALNMAIDKKEIERFKGAGPSALTLIPRLDGYEPPQALPLTVRGETCDVLSFNPSGARSLLSAAGYGGRALRIDFLYPTQGDNKERFEILQKQLRTHLGVDLVPVPRESSVWSQDVNNLQHRGIASWADVGLYPDPVYFLDQFLAGSPANVTGWTDPRYDAAMAEAKSRTDPARRLRMLAGCEEMLLRAMPVIPLFYDAWKQLRKPYVRGIEGNAIDAIAFHRAWIDLDWRPQ